MRTPSTYTPRLVCPRCESYMYPPRLALSRLDNITSVCPSCGQDEAIEMWQNGSVTDYKKEGSK